MSTAITPHDADKQEALALLSAAFREGKQRDAVGAAARAALTRLVKACYPHDNGQAVTIARCLASIYNGGDARPVQLDRIRSMDWKLQKDMVLVIVGCGAIGFPDHEIREEFRRIGGQAAVDWFHWHTTGGPHRRALERLCEFIREHAACSSARNLRALLQSIIHSGNTATLACLGHIDDEHTKDFVLVLDGLYGRDQGHLHVEDIQQALAL